MPAARGRGLLPSRCVLVSAVHGLVPRFRGAHHRARGKLPDLAPREVIATPVPELDPPRRPVEGLVQRTLEDLWVRRRERTEAGDDDGVVVSPDQESGPLSFDGERRELSVNVEGLSLVVPGAYPSPEAMDTADSPAAASGSELADDKPFLPDEPGWQSTGSLRRVGHSHAYEIERVPDANYLGYTDRRWLVSRKRNDTLGNHVNKWRKRMLKVETFSAEDLALLDRAVDDWQ